MMKTTTMMATTEESIRGQPGFDGACVVAQDQRQRDSSQVDVADS